MRTSIILRFYSDSLFLILHLPEFAVRGSSDQPREKIFTELEKKQIHHHRKFWACARSLARTRILYVMMYRWYCTELIFCKDPLRKRIMVHLQCNCFKISNERAPIS